jgi:thiamine pyridinylase
MNSRRHIAAILVCFALLYFGSSGCGGVANRTSLHVALFPYIPDSANDHFDALRKRIKTEFESANPGVDLVLDPIDPNSEVFYDLPSLEKLMSPASPTGQADLVETDTLFLGGLVADGQIEKWDSLPREGDWHPAAQTAVFLNGDCYGVPHWLCTFFVFSPLKEISGAKTAQELVQILNAKGTHPVHFAGNFAGSFTLPAIYLDAYAETHGPGSAQMGLFRPLDPSVVSSIRAMTDEGAHDGKNPCLDGTLKDDKDITVVVPAFARGDIDSFFGYSERLQHILSDNSKAPAYTIIAAPVGQGQRPLLYVDAFVLRKGVSDAQRKAARAFADYMNSPSTEGWILMSKDAQGAVPRYLLPATKSAFDTLELRDDPYYPMLKADIADGHAFPTSGYVERKIDLQTSLLMQLTGGH